MFFPQEHVAHYKSFFKSHNVATSKASLALAYILTFEESSMALKD